jgi:hypothetical protein
MTTEDLGAPPAQEGKRPVESWLLPEPGRELALAPGESRTIVIDTAVATGGHEDAAVYGDEARGARPQGGSPRGARPQDGSPQRGEARRGTEDNRPPHGDASRAAAHPAAAAGASLADEAPQRRTVRISGHPDRLPASRASRPPRSAVDRIGTRPDLIAGYAVLLGFLLIAIAILTTGQ